MTAPARSDAPAFALAPETPYVLSGKHRTTLLRAAVARNPAHLGLRTDLACLLFDDDDFPGAIALLDTLVVESSMPALQLMLADALLSLRTADADRRAETAARAALDLVGDDAGRATVLALLGKTLIRQDRLPEARAVLNDALAIDRHHIDAFKRLAAIVANGETARLTVIDDLLGHGVRHACLLGTRATALAEAGRIDDAQAAIGLDRFLGRRILAPPPGWPTLASLHADIARELLRNPDIRFDREGAASSQTWRVERPLTPGATALAALQGAILTAIRDYVAALGDVRDVPWLCALPTTAKLHLSCVITDAKGFETWHMHERSWLSGVYYIDVPAAVTNGIGRQGCLAFGLPDDSAGPAAAAAALAYGERIVRPEPGLLLLFPSHAYHRTFPHGSDQRRICLAFDVLPDI